MRVAFLGQKGIPAAWGGIETHVDAVATRLAARGHEVTVYVRRWWDPDAGEQHRGVRLRRVPGVRTKHLDAASHSALAALGACVASNDIVHVHGIGPALFAVLPRLAGRRVVVTIHALDYRSPKWGMPARAALRLGEQSALRLAHCTLVVSRGLEEHYRARGHCTEYLPNGVDASEPAPPDWIRRHLGLSGSDYWLSLGRWADSKRVVELVEGYRRLAGTKPPLVLAGGDPDGGEYARAVVAACADCPEVIRPGFVTAGPKRELLSNALGVVTAASHEGLPIALLEAMSHGRPCLVSDIPAHREVAGDGGALVVPMRTPGEVAAGLERFRSLSMPERRALGEAGRLRVAADYQWDRIVDRLETIYRTVTFG